MFHSRRRAVAITLAAILCAVIVCAMLQRAATLQPAANRPAAAATPSEDHSAATPPLLTRKLSAAPAQPLGSPAPNPAPVAQRAGDPVAQADAWPVDVYGRFVLHAIRGAEADTARFDEKGCSRAAAMRLEREFGTLDGRRVDTRKPLPRGSVPPSLPAAVQARMAAAAASPIQAGAAGLIGDVPAGPMTQLSPAELRGLSGEEFVNRIAGSDGLDAAFFSTSDPDTLAALAEPRVAEVIAAAGTLLGAEAVANAAKLHRTLYFLRAAAFVDFYSTSLSYSQALRGSVSSLLGAIANDAAFMDAGFAQPRSEWCVVGDSWEYLDDYFERAVDILERYRLDPSLHDLGPNYYETIAIYNIYVGVGRTARTHAGWVGKYSDRFLNVTEEYALRFAPSPQTEFLVNDAIYALGNLRATEPAGKYQGRGHQVLTAVLTTRPQDSGPFLEAMRMLELSPFDSRRADGSALDIAGYRVALAGRVFPNTYTYDAGAIAFHTALTPETVNALYDGLQEVKAHFHRVTQALRPADDDPHAQLKIRLYASRRDYESYHTFLYNLSTSNGGIYIERDATYYSYERTAADSIYTLEELVRHEYTHYLDAYYLITPSFGGSPFYNGERLTWHSEGIAEFLAGSRRTRGIAIRQKMLRETLPAGKRMTIAKTTAATYGSGFGFYQNAAMLFAFLSERHPEKLWPYFRAIYANDVASYDALGHAWRADAALQTEYDAFLEAANAEIANGARVAAEEIPTDYRPSSMPESTLGELASSFAAVAGPGVISTPSAKRYHFERVQEFAVPGANIGTPERFQQAASARVDEVLTALTPVGGAFASTTGWFELLSFSGATARARLIFEGLYAPAPAPAIGTLEGQLVFAPASGSGADEVLALTVTNSGQEPLVITAATISSEIAGLFELEQTVFPVTVPAESSVKLFVRLHAALLFDLSAGNYEGALLIQADNGEAASLSVPLQAQRTASLHVDSRAPEGGDGSSWTNAYRTISEAIAAAPTGAETILIAGGTYVESIRVGHSLALFGGYAGADGPAERDPDAYPTVIDVTSKLTRGVIMTGKAPVFDGFGVVGGIGVGGGLQIVNVTGEAQVRRCSFERNQTDSYGGAVSVHNSSAVFEAVSICNNRASGAAGLLVSPGAKVTLRRCLVAGNTATDAYGGGVMAVGGTLTIEDSTVAANRASIGGGLCVASGGSITVRGSLIAGNVASQRGGAGVATESRAATFEHCVFYRNRDGGGADGLTSDGGSAIVLRNSIFFGHHGALVPERGEAAAEIEAMHCLFAGNAPDYRPARGRGITGAAALNRVGQNFTNALSGNPRWQLTPFGGKVVAARYNRILNETTVTLAKPTLAPGALRYAVIEFGGTKVAVVSQNTARTFTVIGRHDTLSAWRSWRQLNFHLAANSPAIDAGTGGAGKTDPDGNPRGVDLPEIASPAGDGTDIGLYEFQPN